MSTPGHSKKLALGLSTMLEEQSHFLPSPSSSLRNNQKESQLPVETLQTSGSWPAHLHAHTPDPFRIQAPGQIAGLLNTCLLHAITRLALLSVLQGLHALRIVGDVNARRHPYKSFLKTAEFQLCREGQPASQDTGNFGKLPQKGCARQPSQKACAHHAGVPAASADLDAGAPVASRLFNQWLPH